MRSASASSQVSPAMISASPTAAEPMSLTRPICGSIARLTRSASFSMAVFRSATTSTNTTTPISVSRFQADSATTKASGSASANATSSWRNASSLRVAAIRPFQVLMVARSSRSMVRLDGRENGEGGSCVALLSFHRISSKSACCRQLTHRDEVIRAELDAPLQEHAEILRLPFDGLRERRQPDHVILEMRGTAGLHVPVAAADAHARPIVHLIGQEGIDLVAPAGAFLGNRTGEVADIGTDAQPVAVGTGHPDERHPGGIDAEAETAEVECAIDAQA